MTKLPTGYNPQDLPGQIVDEGWGGRISDPNSGAGLFNANTDYNVVGVDPITGENAPIGTDMAFGAAVRRWISAGVYNGDFAVPPAAPESVLEDAYNMLPYWSFQPTQSGQIVALVSSNAASPTGYHLILRMVGGGYDADDAYITQLVPVSTTADGSWSFFAGLSLEDIPTTVVGSLLYIQIQFLDRALATSAGSPNSSIHETTIAVGGARTIRTPSIVIPDDAYYARLRVGLRRGTAAVTDAAEVHVSEVFAKTEPNTMTLSDSTSYASTWILPPTYPSIIRTAYDPVLRVATVDGYDAIQIIHAMASTAGAGYGYSRPEITLATSRGTLASPLAVESSNDLGGIVWRSYDGSTMVDSASITANTAGPRVTGILELLTGQLKFPTTQNPSSDVHVLDDYEEGTWTPTSAVPLLVDIGRYTKVGRLVTVEFYVHYLTNLDATQCKVASLPFTVGTYNGASVGYSNLGQEFHLYAAPGTSALLVWDMSGGAIAHQTFSDKQFTGTFTYSV